MIMIGAGTPCRDLTGYDEMPNESSFRALFRPGQARSVKVKARSGSQLIKGMNHQAAFHPNYFINRQCMTREYQSPLGSGIYM